MGLPEIGRSRTKAADHSERSALQGFAVGDPPRSQVRVETLADDIGYRTTFALSQLPYGGPLFFGELDLGAYHDAIMLAPADGM